MRILLTGSQGYIGIHLAQALLEAGFAVTGLDTGFYNDAWLFDGIQKFAPLISKDVRHVSVDDLRGFDAVIHLAELSNDPLGEINADVTMAINHQGTVHLAQTAKAAGIKQFIYFSSCSVYGASDTISDETSPTNPITTYAKCKILNEQALLALADETFSPIIFRNATAYGVSPRMRFDLVVNNLAGVAWTTKQIKMESDGTPWRPFVHISDICRAVICALNAPRDVVHNQVFNVGNNRSNYQIRDIADIIGQTFPGCQVSLNKNGVDKRNYRVNFDKINSLLSGFACQADVASGAQELRNVFEQIAMDEQMFQSRLYTRLKQIRHLQETGQLDKQLFWQKSL